MYRIEVKIEPKENIPPHLEVREFATLGELQAGHKAALADPRVKLVEIL